MNEKKMSKPSRYSTGTKSYRIYLPFVIFILIIYTIYLIIVTPSNTDLIPIINGSGINDFLVILIVIPMIGLLLVPLTPIIAIGYYKLYTRIFRDYKLYYLDMHVQLGKWTSRDIIKRSLNPGLLICALSQIVVNTTGLSLWVVGGSQDLKMFALFNAGFVVFPIVVVLLAPLWLLYDSGVMSKTNLDRKKKKRSPETVETLEKFFSSKLKGFSGLAFILNFISMIFQTILLTLPLLMIIFVILVPFLGIALIIPVQALYEKLLPFLTKKVHAMTKLHVSKLSLVSGHDCPACNPKLWR